MTVHEVADVLTSLSPDNDDHHRMFLENHVQVLVLAVNYSEIIISNYELQLELP